MHIGDRWRVRFSYSLGYGANAAGTIPAYSDLIFDIALLDFWHPGEQVPNFKSR
jgi:FKBP-type peptidyl-prolyl cis-trans isomerase FklB